MSRRTAKRREDFQMSIQEMIQEARAVAVSPMELAVCAQARALVKIAEREGVPFKVESVKDVGPCKEAGCSRWAREERITFRLPDGKSSGGWSSYDPAYAAEEMLRKVAS
jgi:hypothetical protein